MDHLFLLYLCDYSAKYFEKYASNLAVWNFQLIARLKIQNKAKKSGDFFCQITERRKMAPLSFAIPLQRKDLLCGSNEGQYFVQNEYSIRELKTKLVVSLTSQLEKSIVWYEFRFY